MFVEALRLAAALLLLVALPGWLLTKALFPRGDALAPLERVYVALAGGILLVILVAGILGFLPHAGRGHLQSLAAGGMPNVEFAMTGVCFGLLCVGVARGAFPRLAARWPSGWPGGARSRPQGRDP